MHSTRRCTPSLNSTLCISGGVTSTHPHLCPHPHRPLLSKLLFFPVLVAVGSRRSSPRMWLVCSAPAVWRPSPEATPFRFLPVTHHAVSHVSLPRHCQGHSGILRCWKFSSAYPEPQQCHPGGAVSGIEIVGHSWAASDPRAHSRRVECAVDVSGNVEGVKKRHELSTNCALTQATSLTERAAERVSCHGSWTRERRASLESLDASARHRPGIM